MTENTVVRARIDEQIKKEASAVLASIGLTASDAFRMMMTRIAKEKALPFEPLVPNEETIAAMRKNHSDAGANRIAFGAPFRVCAGPGSFVMVHDGALTAAPSGDRCR